MARRLLALLCALVIAACMLPALALAEGDDWIDYADTGWYNEHKNTFDISTAAQLAGLAKLVNKSNDDFDGDTVRLTADIDLSGKEWTPIGGDWVFNGTFDGGGHVVKGLVCTKGRKDGNGLYYGLFGAVDGTVKDLGVEGATVTVKGDFTNGGGAGILVGQLVSDSSQVENCFSTGTIKATDVKLGQSYLPGLGGLVGNVWGSCSIVGCYSTADVSYEPSGEGTALPVGGMVGFFANVRRGGLVEDCWFGGSLESGSRKSSVGGIVGWTYNGLSVRNCAVYATGLESANPNNLSWIASVDDASRLERCFWPKVTGGPLKDIPAARKNSGRLWELKAGDPCLPADLGEGSKAYADASSTLQDLEANAGEGIVWVMGTKHPTFDWDYLNDPADYTGLEKAIEKAKALKESDCASGYPEVRAALAVAEALVGRTAEKDQQKVDEAKGALVKAMRDVVYKPAKLAGLKSAIEDAKALKPEDYANYAACKARIEAALKAAEDLLAEKPDITRQKEVNAKAQALDEAMDALVYKSANYEALDDTIKKAEGLKESDYKSGFPEVKAALEAARALARDLDVTQQPKVDRAKDDLEKAMDVLVYRPADYEALDVAIKKAKALDPDDYTNYDDCKTRIRSALEAAENVKRDLDITHQTEIDKAKDALLAAMGALVRVYPPVIDQPSGTGQAGTVTVDPRAPKAGDKVTVRIVPPAGKAVDKVTVTDESGKEIPVTKEADGTYTYTQPKGKVTVKVSYKDVPSGYVPSAPDASGGQTATTAPDDAAARPATAAYVGALPKTGDSAPDLPLALFALSGAALCAGALARRTFSR